jgi:hypothetical protein
MIPAPSPSPVMHRFTVDEYERIIMAGALRLVLDTTKLHLPLLQ